MITMQVNIANHKATVIENGVYYFSLSNYPQITPLELKNLLHFIEYEKMHNRRTEIVCESESLMMTVNNAIVTPVIIVNMPLPDKIAGCDACSQKGCLTEFVYHATDIEATAKILSSGKLLSAVKAFGKTADELAYGKRDSLWNDPADFFEYIMFCWGNCVVGDYVVMSDTPDSEFAPGIRLYFRYKDLLRHPGHVFDGYHCIKVKDEIVLSDYLYACIVPEQQKSKLERSVLPELVEKVHYLPQNGLGIYDWSKQIYNFMRRLCLQ